MLVEFKDIPFYNADTDVWSTASFETQGEFALFLEKLFKKPGDYNFDASTKKWNLEAARFEEKGAFCFAPYMSNDFKTYWDTQKDRCRKGVIWKSGSNEWYLDRAYYMLLNFLPIINKEKGNVESFLSVRDVQYHIALYEKIAEARNKHSIITKKRQCASSYWHTAKMINVYWFEKKAILRNLASDENYLIGDTGIWNYYNGYRDFLNEYTAWNRPNSPNKDMSWVQRIEVTNNGVKSFRGRKSIMTGVSLKKSATGGVGGPAYYTYHEEAGIAPKMDKTYIFTKPALSSGLGITTGMFIAAGSVGDLKDCQPLKKFMYSPEENGFLGVPNYFARKDGTIEVTGLYIPEQWGLPGFIDEFGNSKVEEALEYLNETYSKMEAEMDPEDFQLELSQRPRFLDEAFAFRTVSKFPIRKIEKKQDQLKNSTEKTYRKAWLSEEDNGRIKVDFIDREDIKYPVDPKSKDKEGVVLIHKMPEANPALFTYYAGVDNIEVEETTTSKSLFSIYIVEGSTEVKYWDDQGVEKLKIEGDNIVASWTGRLNSVDDTNMMGELLIRLYNAFTLCERNKPNFITHMIKRGYRHLLATAADVPIWKEATDVIDPTKNLEVGIYMDSTGKKQAIADDYLIQWIKQERDAIYKKDSEGMQTNEKVKTITSLDSINDIWLLEELKNEKDNTDRRDALRLAIMLKTIQQAKGRKVSRVETTNRPEINKQAKLTRTINFLGSNNKLNYSKRKINLLG